MVDVGNQQYEVRPLRACWWSCSNLLSNAGARRVRESVFLRFLFQAAAILNHLLAGATQLQARSLNSLMRNGY